MELDGEIDEPRSVMDVAPTIAYFLGVRPPAQSTGQVLAVRDEPAGPKPLAVIIPAHNEAENLPETLSRIPQESLGDTRVIVVDDGSTDGTAEVARAHGADLVARHCVNRGLGAALRTGLEAAREMDVRAAVYLDADGEYPPEQILRLLEPIERREADYVLGSRYLGSRERQTPLRRMGNLFFTAMLSFAAGRTISDGQTGFRALLPPRCGPGGNHPRLQLRPGADSRPASEGNAVAGSAHRLPAPPQGTVLHRPGLPVEGCLQEWSRQLFS